MSDEPQDVNWQQAEPFHIDNGELDGLSPQDCFVLGVEWQKIASLADQPVPFEEPIHTANADRISRMLRKRHRKFSIDTYCQQDDWRWLRVESPFDRHGEGKNE